MHIILANYVYNAGLKTADALLARYATLVGWAEGLRAAGARVTIGQRFHQDVQIERNGVVYHLVADGCGPRLRSWQVPRRLHRLVRASGADRSLQSEPVVIHVNGLLFPFQVRALRAVLPGDWGITVQHHAEKPWRGIRGYLQRWGLGAADGFLFSARELAQPFVQQGAIRSMHDVYQVMEGSSWFIPQEREAAQAVTGMKGAPIFLWVGRLNWNKDPLTVLAGFELVLDQVPSARLYMAYGSEDLLPQVQKRLADSASLGDSVTLLGTVPHVDLEQYYNGAHYFVLGSHYEGSGYALAEALACGLVPIVTDIPSFRVMTDGGRIGALWPPGDPEALAAAMLDQVRRPWEPSSRAAHSFFAEHLSYPAIGRQALGIYHRLATRRSGAAK